MVTKQVSFTGQSVKPTPLAFAQDENLPFSFKGYSIEKNLYTT